MDLDLDAALSRKGAERRFSGWVNDLLHSGYKPYGAPPRIAVSNAPIGGMQLLIGITTDHVSDDGRHVRPRDQKDGVPAAEIGPGASIKAMTYWRPAPKAHEVFENSKRHYASGPRQ